ncbi:hypothetical protein NMG60_11026459 [Bertholletia excelsa]
MANMRLAFGDDSAAVYKPLMPPTSSPHSASATPTPTYQGGGGVGGSAVASNPASINVTEGEQTKKKRGRPRKYSLDGTMAHLPAPLPSQPEATLQPSGFPSPANKRRGRPPGSKRKQQDAAPGVQGMGFTSYVITVKAGEDVCSKIMSFSQNSTRTVCILSANGTISNVTLRQAATSGGTVTYEGRFEILSLSGSYMLSDSGGQRSRTGGLSVLLSGPDGRVLGGGVAGLLTAASPVQIVVGSFFAGKGPKLKSANKADPAAAAAPQRVMPAAPAIGSPFSHGTPSESSGGNGSPLNRNTGACNDKKNNNNDDKDNNDNNPQGMTTTLAWNFTD